MPTGKKTKQKPRLVAEKFGVGTGNVFADMGMADADQRLAKAELAHQVGRLIAALKLPQKEVAKRLGIDQPKVSALLRGRLKAFSTDRLMRFITDLDHDVIITVRHPQEATHPRVRVLANA